MRRGTHFGDGATAHAEELPEECEQKKEVKGVSRFGLRATGLLEAPIAITGKTRESQIGVDPTVSSSDLCVPGRKTQRGVNDWGKEPLLEGPPKGRAEPRSCQLRLLLGVKSWSWNPRVGVSLVDRTPSLLSSSVYRVRPNSETHPFV